MIVWLGVAVIIVSAVLAMSDTGSSSAASLGAVVGVLLIVAGSCSVGPLMGS